MPQKQEYKTRKQFFVRMENVSWREQWKALSSREEKWDVFSEVEVD